MNNRIVRLLRKPSTPLSTRLSPISRSTRGNSYLARLRGISESSTNFSTMAETVPVSEAMPKKEALPKLCASDFRAYNSMAEHMEYFVSSPSILEDAEHIANYSPAQSLSSILESPLWCLRIRQTSLKHIDAPVPHDRTRFLLTFGDAPQY
jgi:hypothetical protein